MQDSNSQASEEAAFIYGTNISMKQVTSTL